MDSRWESIGLVIATLPLPVGILAGIYAGFQSAIAVFVIEWLLFVPLTLLIADDNISVRDTTKSADDPATVDPLAELRHRYARRGIDEAEFEPLPRCFIHLP